MTALTASCRPSGRTIGVNVNGVAPLPSVASLTRSSCVWQSCLMAAWATSNASIMSSSLTSCISPSTITMASVVPETTRLKSDSASCEYVGLTTNAPPTRPMRTIEMGPWNGATGEQQRRAGAHTGEHVGVDLRVGGHHGDHHLHLVKEAVVEERAQAAVDDAAGEDLLVGRTALALDEAAGHLAARGVLLAVVDGEREEALALAHVGRENGGAEHHGVAAADDHRAAGLLGEASGFDGDGTVGAHIRADGGWLDHAGQMGLDVFSTRAAPGRFPGGR